MSVVPMPVQVRQVSIGALETPMGTFRAVFSEQGLGCLAFPREQGSRCETWVRRWASDAERLVGDPRLALLEAELTAYVNGTLRAFSTPVHLLGTPFQVQVWSALRTIGYGEVLSYAQIAAAICRPAAVRAVGAAIGANPVPIVVPCHRVIGSNGTLTGYGGGLEMKALLLRREGALLEAL